MEPEVSSPHSQQPSNCLYPVPARSGPYLDIPFPELHFNFFLPSTPGSPKWSLSVRLPHQNPVYSSLLHHTHYMPRPSNSSQFYHQHNFGWGIQIIKLRFMKFSAFPCCLVPLRPKIFSSALYSLTFWAYVPPSMWTTEFHTHTNNRQNYSSVYLNL